MYLFFSFSAYHSGLFHANLQHQKSFKTEVSELGIILQHDYSKATLSPEQLKGKDRSLYKIFNNTSLNIELTPISVEVTGRRTRRERSRGNK